MKRNKLEHTLPIDNIALVVCKYFNKSIDEVFIKTKKGNIVEVRQYFHYFCILFSNDSYSDIASFNDYFLSHTDIVYSKNKIINNIELYSDVNKIIYDIYLLLFSRLRLNKKSLKIDAEILSNAIIYKEKELNSLNDIVKSTTEKLNKLLLEIENISLELNSRDK